MENIVPCFLMKNNNLFFFVNNKIYFMKKFTVNVQSTKAHEYGSDEEKFRD